MAWFMDTYSMHVGHTVDRGRHRQAGRDGRLARPPRGDRPRRDDHRARVGQAPRLRAQGRDASPCRASATSARSPPSCSHEQGAKIVAVTDWKGGVYNADGPRHPALLALRPREHKTVAGFPGAEPLTNDELFKLDVDILIPAALENQITADNAARHQGEDGHRRRQRPDHARRAPAPARARRLRRPRHPGQRRRRHRLVLRVGAGPARLLLDREGSERAPRGEDGARPSTPCSPRRKKYNVDMRTAAYIVAINRVATVTQDARNVRVTARGGIGSGQADAVTLACERRPRRHAALRTRSTRLADHPERDQLRGVGAVGALAAISSRYSPAGRLASGKSIVPRSRRRRPARHRQVGHLVALPVQQPRGDGERRRWRRARSASSRTSRRSVRRNSRVGGRRGGRIVLDRLELAGVAGDVDARRRQPGLRLGEVGHLDRRDRRCRARRRACLRSTAAAAACPAATSNRRPRPARAAAPPSGAVGADLARGTQVSPAASSAVSIDAGPPAARPLPGVRRNRLPHERDPRLAVLGRRGADPGADEAAASRPLGDRRPATWLTAGGGPGLGGAAARAVSVGGQRPVALARAHLRARPLHAHLDLVELAVLRRLRRVVAEQVVGARVARRSASSPLARSLRLTMARPSVSSASTRSVSCVWRSDVLAACACRRSR